FLARSFRRRLGMHWTGGRHFYGGSRSRCYSSAFTAPSVSWRVTFVRRAPLPYSDRPTTASGIGSARISRKSRVRLPARRRRQSTKKSSHWLRHLGKKFLIRSA